MTNTKTSLPVFLWLWLPLAFMAVQIVMELTLSWEFRDIMHSEGGPHETFQALFVFIAFLLAIFTIWKMPKDNKWLVSWLGLAAVCSLYVAGEEVSWGQHIIGWATPEFWLEYNDQSETNLHNTSSWLDQKPRLLLLVGAFVGAIVIPLFQKKNIALFPQKFAVIYPSGSLALIAFFAVAVNLGDKVAEATLGHPFFARGSEVEEVLLFYFVALYIYLLYKRSLN